MTVEDTYRGRLGPCPRCGWSDNTLSVPSSFNAARAAEAARRVMNDDDAIGARRRDAAAIVSSAPPVGSSGELAMAPNNAAGCGAIFLFVVGIFILVCFGIWATETQTTTHHGIAVVLAKVAVLEGLLLVCLTLMLRRFFRLRSKIASGKPAAEMIWRRGWHCYRCAIVYFQPGEEPPGVRSGQALSPTEFQRIVWTAGGYADHRAR